MYKELENKFKPLYPSNNSATYSSLLNFSNDMDVPFQRWFRYKEGFSVSFVNEILDNYEMPSSSIILDPFLGGGSTLLSASNQGMKSLGFEVNPFSLYLSKVKLTNYSEPEINKFFLFFNELLKKSTTYNLINYKLPDLSFSNKVFPSEIGNHFLGIKELIENKYRQNENIYNLLKLGWLSQLEFFSNYRKGGNGLKIRKYKNPRMLTKHDVNNKLLTQYYSMYLDLLNFRKKRDVRIFDESSLFMENLIEEGSVSAIIFSPPYANCFDYTEIYKLELWFGDFVKSYDEMKKLRRNSIRSHLSSNLDNDSDKLILSPFLQDLIDQLSVKRLWDKKIPLMISKYFEDMNSIISQSYKLLQKNGICCIVVGNSSYGGVIIPTDLFISEIGMRAGFAVDQFIIDRFLITSSQQYYKTIHDRNLLRESVICLKK